jgi:prepilin peptidase CpaA
VTDVYLPIIVTASLACLFDVRTRRIPNVLSLGSALAAVMFHAVGWGWGGLGAALAGWVVGAAMFFPFFALRGMGAGDVKLIAALGAWLGPATGFWLVIYTLIAGGVIAVALTLPTGYLPTAVSNIAGLFRYWSVAGLKPHPELTLASAAGPRLPYAVPILAGVIVTLWLR